MKLEKRAFGPLSPVEVCRETLTSNHRRNRLCGLGRELARPGQHIQLANLALLGTKSRRAFGGIQHAGDKWACGSGDTHAKLWRAVQHRRWAEITRGRACASSR